MKATIEVVLAPRLAAKSSRAVVVKRAVGEHLRELSNRRVIELDRKGYLAMPQTEDEYLDWEAEQVWPED